VLSIGAFERTVDGARMTANSPSFPDQTAPRLSTAWNIFSTHGVCGRDIACVSGQDDELWAGKRVETAVAQERMAMNRRFQTAKQRVRVR
jgi:hypothetical protein